MDGMLGPAAGSTEHELAEVASEIWGVHNDATYYDGWRARGDVWAARYLLRQLRRGVDLRHADGPSREELVGRLEALI